MVAALAANAQTFNIDAQTRGDKISPTLYGIFFEEINHAGDGRLYAELIGNRSFENTSSPMKGNDFGENYISRHESLVKPSQNVQLNLSMLHIYLGTKYASIENQQKFTLFYVEVYYLCA